MAYNAPTSYGSASPAYAPVQPASAVSVPVQPVPVYQSAPHSPHHQHHHHHHGGGGFLYGKHLFLKRNVGCGGAHLEVVDAASVAVLLAKYETPCFGKTRLVVRDGMGKAVAQIGRESTCFGAPVHKIFVNNIAVAEVRRDPRECMSRSYVAVSAVSGVITHELRPEGCGKKGIQILRQEPHAKAGSGHTIAKAFPGPCQRLDIAIDEDVPQAELDLVLLLLLTRAMVEREQSQDQAAASRAAASL